MLSLSSMYFSERVGTAVLAEMGCRRRVGALSEVCEFVAVHPRCSRCRVCARGRRHRPRRARFVCGHDGVR